MRIYKVRVRRWYPSDKTGKLRDGVWCDEKVLVEGDSLDHAREVGFDAVMGAKFFGVAPAQCEVMEVATVNLPLSL